MEVYELQRRVERLPFVSLPWAVFFVLAYWATLAVLKKTVHGPRRGEYKSLVIAHNLFLSCISGVLFVIGLTELVPYIKQHGLHSALCDSEVTSERMLRLYYLNYLLKIYELIDTVFLVLNQKPLTFLHVYHHSMTLLLCYSQLYGVPSLQWVPIMANLAVHLVMYFYYALVASGRRVSWKEWVTRLQIIQFVVDLLACVYGIARFELHNFGLSETSCFGLRSTAYFGISVLASYLVLFLQFYRNTYTSPTKKTE